MTPLLIIGGATGSGKSALAVAVAKLINGEVISADSMQVYRGLNVGTAKITPEEMKGVPHHLIDVVDPLESFTVADYKERANRCIKEIFSRGKVPILCGGTGLYIDSVLFDMSFSGAFDPALRAALQEEAKALGKQAMHAKLCALDPIAGERLHVNDEKRVLRAIEKAMTGGREEDDLSRPKYPYKLFLTEMPRETLYRRIEKRVDLMMQNGLKAEVDGLLASGVGYDKQCMQAIAYKEWALTEDGVDQAAIVELIKKNTRNYAKRQGTWFRRYPDAICVDVTQEPIDALAEKIKFNYCGD